MRKYVKTFENFEFVGIYDETINKTATPVEMLKTIKDFYIPASEIINKFTNTNEFLKTYHLLSYKRGQTISPNIIVRCGQTTGVSFFPLGVELNKIIQSDITTEALNRVSLNNIQTAYSYLYTIDANGKLTKQPYYNITINLSNDAYFLPEVDKTKLVELITTDLSSYQNDYTIRINLKYDEYYTNKVKSVDIRLIKNEN